MHLFQLILLLEHFREVKIKLSVSFSVREARWSFQSVVTNGGEWIRNSIDTLEKNMLEIVFILVVCDKTENERFLGRLTMKWELSHTMIIMSWENNKKYRKTSQ